MRDSKANLNFLHVIADGGIIVFSYLFAWYMRFRSGLFELQWSLSFGVYLRALIFIVPAYIILYYAFNLYTSKRVQGRRLELANIIKANTVGLLGFILILYLFRQEHFSRTMMFIFYGTNIFLETLMRNILRMVLRRIRRKGKNQKYMLLVGYSRAAEEFIDRVRMNPEWGYTIRGIIDDTAPRGTEYKNIKVLGGLENLEFILPENKIDEIVITLGLNEYSKLESIVSLCEKSGVHTKFVPDYNNVIPTKPYTEDLLGLPVVHIRRVPLNSPFNSFIKRMEDLFGGLLAIILFSPVMLVVAIAIKLSSPGPVIFSQVRVGLHNKEFKMYKFRSMRQQTKEEEAKGWTTKNDPRITKVGKFIRKTSIDELPQLFNILKGDMSMVGPRPERPQFVEKFKEEIPRYMIKHQVRPGMTGWAQVNGYRGDTSIRKRIEYDLYYIENWTIGLDFKILIMTVFTGFINKNAY